MSDWNVHVHANMGGMPWPLISFPFPIDIARFHSNISHAARTKVMLYNKKRDPALLTQVKKHLVEHNINYTVFDYHFYEEENYRELLRQAQYGIWVGNHESQGFAFQEALSSGVPLLVLDVLDMRDELDEGKCHFCKYDRSQFNLTATAASTWSPLAGEKVNTFREYEHVFHTFTRNVQHGLYDPRAVVMKLLSPKACADRLMLLYDFHRELSCKEYLKVVDEFAVDAVWRGVETTSFWFSSTAYRTAEEIRGQ